MSEPHLCHRDLKSLKWVPVFCSVLMLMSCASAHKEATPEEATNMLPESPILMSGYLLDIRVMVSGVNEINEKGLRVQEDGTLTLPFLGSVKCEGMRLDDFKSKLTHDYNAKYFINPIVSVSISIDDNASTFPWGYVTVLGQVKEPGRIRIPPTRDLTVMQAIQQAGSFIKYAKKKGIEITRADKDGTTDRMMFDVRDVAGSAGGEADIQLEHGDVVFVPEVIF